MSERKQGAAPRRVGIVGAGYISDFHIGALRKMPGVTVTAMCEPNSDRARAAQKRWLIPGTFDSLSAMLRSEERPEVVHILTPPSRHSAAAIECLEAGCDVFVEKPAATNDEECASIALAARRSGRVVGVNHNACFHPAFQQLAREIRDWSLGSIQHVTAVVNVPLRQLTSGQHGHWMFQEPENIVLEQAPHPLSQIQALLGDFGETTVLRSGRIRLNTGKTFFRTWQISAICKRGTATLLLSFGREHAEQSLHALGQDGAVFVDLRRNTLCLTRKTRFVEPVDAFSNGLESALRLAGSALGNLKDYSLSFLRLRPSSDPFIAGMRGSINAFYEALAEGRPIPVDLKQATEVIRVCGRIGRDGVSECNNRTLHAANV